MESHGKESQLSQITIRLVQHGEREFTYAGDGEDAAAIREAIAAAPPGTVPDLYDLTNMDRSDADPDEHLTVLDGSRVLWSGWLGGARRPEPGAELATLREQVRLARLGLLSVTLSCEDSPGALRWPVRGAERALAQVAALDGPPVPQPPGPAGQPSRADVEALVAACTSWLPADAEPATLEAFRRLLAAWEAQPEGAAPAPASLAVTCGSDHAVVELGGEVITVIGSVLGDLDQFASVEAWRAACQPEAAPAVQGRDGEAGRWRVRNAIVEAIQWTGRNEAGVAAFASPGNGSRASHFGVLDDEDRANCDDPEATAQLHDNARSRWVLVKAGDWIVKGITGAFFVVGDDKFRQDYELAPAAQDGEPPARYAVVEAMGHRTLIGAISDATVAGVPVLRLARLDGQGEHLIAPMALYMVTPCSEALARAAQARLHGGLPPVVLAAIGGAAGALDEDDDPYAEAGRDYQRAEMAREDGDRASGDRNDDPEGDDDL